MGTRGYPVGRCARSPDRGLTPVNDIVTPAGRTDREAVIRLTAAARSLPDALIEKDLWACWVLSRLFALHDGQALPHLTFKGGTSLSKAYELIRRFSEDIDLSLDRRHEHLRSPSGEPDPVEALGSLSNTKLKKLVGEIRQRAADLVATSVRDALRADFTERLKCEEGRESWSLHVDETVDDGLTLLFHYPTSGEPDRVRIEYGIGDPDPYEMRTIQPYTAEECPQSFGTRTLEARVLLPVRTFWEKATMLHRFAHRFDGDRGWEARDKARHYYDVVQITEKLPVEEWNRPDVFDQVMRANRAMYSQQAWKTAEHDSLCLVPHEKGVATLGRDYRRMNEMFFPEPPPPSWERVVEKLRAVEQTIKAG